MYFLGIYPENPIGRWAPVSHRAVLYTVSVHRERERGEPRLLGNIDQKGTGLLGVLEGCLPALSVRDGSRALRYLRSSAEGDELTAMFECGQDGVQAIIKDENGH